MKFWRHRMGVDLPRTAVVLHDLAMVWLCWNGLRLIRYALVGTPSTSLAVVRGDRHRPARPGPGPVARRPVSRAVAVRQRPDLWNLVKAGLSA